jgi:GAF domain-containing protein
MSFSAAAGQLTHDRLRRLQAVTAALSAGVGTREIGEIVLHHLDLLDVRAGSLSLVRPPGELEVVAHTGYSDDVVRPFQRMRLDARVPLTDAVRTGVPVFLRSREETELHYPQLLPLVRQTDRHAMAALPLLADGRAFGALGLSFPQPRSFLEDERDFLIAVAEQTVVALRRCSLAACVRMLEDLSAEELAALRREVDRRLDR